MRFTRPSLSAALAVIAVYAAVVFYSAWCLRTDRELPGGALMLLALLVVAGLVASVTAQWYAPGGVFGRLLVNALGALVAVGAMLIKSAGTSELLPGGGRNGEWAIIASVALAVFTLALPALLIPRRRPEATRLTRHSIPPE